MRRRLSLLCALVVGVSLLSAPTPAVAAYEPPNGPVFNVPNPWGTTQENNRILATVTKAIRRTRPTKRQPDPFILVSSFLLDYSPSVNQLIDACKRGVSVRVLLNDDIDNRNSRRLISALNGDNKGRTGPCGTKKTNSRITMDSESQMMTRTQARTSLSRVTADRKSWGRDGSYAKQCVGACRGRDGANMHAKFYVFSRTGKARNVAMVSSSNLNVGGARLGWNDLVIMKRRRAAVDFYKKMHLEMTAEKRAARRGAELRDYRYTHRFYPMPGATRVQDPVMKDLRKIRCHGPLGATKIHVSMFYWRSKRGNWIASKLLNLARDGCKVDIIYGAPSRKLAERLRKAAGRGLIGLWDSRWDCDEDGWNEVRTHGKYVAVRGAVGKRDRTAQVWTGTGNWVMGSLRRADENSVNVRSPAHYRKYRSNWNDIRLHSRRLPYWKYPKGSNGIGCPA